MKRHTKEFKEFSVNETRGLSAAYGSVFLVFNSRAKCVGAFLSGERAGRYMESAWDRRPGWLMTIMASQDLGSYLTRAGMRELDDMGEVTDLRGFDYFTSLSHRLGLRMI